VTRRSKIGWASLLTLGGCLASAAQYTLNRGILTGSTLSWQSTHDLRAGKIHNAPLRKCRYLHLSGLAEREILGDAAQPPCEFFRSD
jgi:hypothetical protein